MFSLKEKERFIDKNKEIFSMSLIMPPSKNKNIFHNVCLHCKIENMLERLYHLFCQSIRKDKIAMNNYIIYMETKQK